MEYWSTGALLFNLPIHTLLLQLIRPWLFVRVSPFECKVPTDNGKENFDLGFVADLTFDSQPPPWHPGHWKSD